jgi:hypothetical protein
MNRLIVGTLVALLFANNCAIAFHRVSNDHLQGTHKQTSESTLPDVEQDHEGTTEHGAGHCDFCSHGSVSVPAATFCVASRFDCQLGQFGFFVNLTIPDPPRHRPDKPPALS